MSKEINIKRWIENFNDGKYLDPHVDTQIDAGWYDWFCNDTSLANKTKALGKKLIMISKSHKIDIENQYVWFKNNCPVNGSLYDDIRIADIETGDVVYTITPRCGHNSSDGMGHIWGKENKFKEPLFEGTWGEIKKWFL